MVGEVFGEGFVAGEFPPLALQSLDEVVLVDGPDEVRYKLVDALGLELLLGWLLVEAMLLLLLEFISSAEAALSTIGCHYLGLTLMHYVWRLL